MTSYVYVGCYWYMNYCLHYELVNNLLTVCHPSWMYSCKNYSVKTTSECLLQFQVHWTTFLRQKHVTAIILPSKPSLVPRPTNSLGTRLTKAWNLLTCKSTMVGTAGRPILALAAWAGLENAPLTFLGGSFPAKKAVWALSGCLTTKSATIVRSLMSGCG